jgi:hypothetical protein
MHLIKDVTRYEVVLSSLKLFQKYAESFIPLIEGKEIEVIDLISKHLESKNRQLKDTASSILVKFCGQLSVYISDNRSKLYYQELLNFLLRRLKNLILQVEDPNVLITCIQSYGSLGKAIKTLQGEKRLHECLHFLIENTEATLFTKLDRFENFDFEKNPQNFKAVLFNQKQLISYLRSLSFIIVETSDLEPYEVNFIFKIIKISIKYLTNYFPPYVKNLCESFSLFLNSLPVMNYNKIIFRLHITTIIESMQKHCDITQLSCENVFRDFYEKVISDKLSLDKQSISLEQYINILFTMIEKSEVKSIDVYSMPKIAESTIEKQFYFVVLLFVEILQQEHFMKLLESQGKAALNLYCIAETKLISNPKNFLMLRLVTHLLNVKEVREHVNYSQETVASFKELVEMIENAKGDYKDFQSIHQEFIVVAFRIVKEEFMVQIYKRFLMGIFTSNIESKTLTLHILFSIRFYLEHPGMLTDGEKKTLLEYLFKYASKFAGNVSAQSDQQFKSKFVLYLNDETISNEQVFNRILEISKLFVVEKQGNADSKVEYSVIDSSSLLSKKYQLQNSNFNFSNEILFIHIVDEIIENKEAINDSAKGSLLYLLGREIYTSYKSHLGAATQVDHEKFLLVVSKTLHLLKISSELSAISNDPFFEILILFFSLIFTNDQNFKQNIVSVLKQAKDLYIHDYEKLNLNNRTFLEIFCVLFKSCISKGFHSESNLIKDTSAIREILDFVKINVYSPYEPIQIFNMQIYEIFFNFLIQKTSESTLLNEFFEIFISILQGTNQKENFSLTMKKTFENLFEMSLVLSTHISNSSVFDQSRGSAMLINCIENVCSHDDFSFMFNKMKIFIKFLSIEFFKNSVVACLKDKTKDSTVYPAEVIRLSILSIFVSADAEQKIKRTFELVRFYQQNIKFKDLIEELKTLFLLLLNYNEMEVINFMLEDKETVSYFLSFLFEGTISLFDKNLKYSHERLSNHISENRVLKEHILPFILNKELKNDLFKNINDLSRNQFHKKLRVLYLFLKAFSTEEIKGYIGQSFIQVLYVNLKDILLTRHETSLEYNKAKSLFNFMMKLKIIDIGFCFEVIKQDKVSEFTKVIHRNVSRFSKAELQTIFSQIVESVYLENKIVQFTKFLNAVSQENSAVNLEFIIDVDCFVEDQKFFEENLNQFLEFLIELSLLNIQITDKNVKTLQANLIKTISSKVDFDCFILFSFLNIFNKENFVLAILQNLYEFLKLQIFKQVPTNLSSLEPTTREFEKFAEFIHIMFSLSSKIQSLDFLSLTYFLMPDKKSNFNEVFDFDSKQFVLHFFSQLNFRKFISEFVAVVAKSNCYDHGKFDYLVHVSSHIVQHFIAGLSCDEIIAVFESILLEAFPILDATIEHCKSADEVNDIFVKKIIFTNLIEWCLAKLSKEDINDIVFSNVQKKLFWDNKTPGFVTKRLCLVISQSLSKTPLTQTKLNEISKNSSEDINLTSNAKLIKMLQSLTKCSYNLLVGLISKTQAKLATILNFLIFNDSSKEKDSSLAQIFPEGAVYDFKVLTEFAFENQNFSTFDASSDQGNTVIDHCVTFTSIDMQVSSNDFRPSQIMNESPSRLNVENIDGAESERLSYTSGNNKRKDFASFLRVSTLDKKSKQKAHSKVEVKQPDTEFSNIYNYSLFSAGNPQNRRADEYINSDRRMDIENPIDDSPEFRMIFELDDINQHPCMKKFMTFISAILQRQGEEGLVITKLITLLNLKGSNLSLRLFILKVIFNFKNHLRRFKVA